jgi:uncharacterized protein
MGDELRDQDGVTSGAQSVTEYAEASAQLASDAPDDRVAGQRRLDAIADYNRYDCVSTLRLRDWLLRLAAERGVNPHPVGQNDELEAGPDLELSTTAAALAMHAALADDPGDRKAAALAGSAIDYYQREQKSFWWAHFARLSDPIEDWADTRDVMVIDAGLSRAEDGWREPEGRARLHRRQLRLRGDIAPGSSLKPGSEAYLLYAYPAPFEQRDAIPGMRRWRDRRGDAPRGHRPLGRPAGGAHARATAQSRCAEDRDRGVGSAARLGARSRARLPRSGLRPHAPIAPSNDERNDARRTGIGGGTGGRWKR